MGKLWTNTKYYVTVGKNPYGAAFSKNAEEAIQLAKSAKVEFPNSDVVAWMAEEGQEPFEIWENSDD